RNLDGTVDVNDVNVFVGGEGANNNRNGASEATVTSVDEATKKVTLTVAPAEGRKVYCTYHGVYGFVVYAQDYEVSGELSTEEISPLSQAEEERIETAWAYSGSMSLWDAGMQLERKLVAGIDQTVDEVDVFGKAPVVPSPKHHFLFKKVFGTNKRYLVLKNVTVTSFSESGSGGEISEVSMDLNADAFLLSYTPTPDSGI
ncbi:MAG: hypothetical protein QHH15_06230, partial [Candidatus Thermoplasmatota archaeon]|nr:hypothetical protein [Candidatus Thermoplasmatota archaeon]